MTNDETNPESSPSLAGAMHRITSSPDKELDDRALAAAEALIESGWIWECASQATREEILADITSILRPFLQSKPNP